MSFNPAIVCPTPKEQRDLENLKHGRAISDDTAHRLYELGLCKPIQGIEPDGSVSITGWEISDNGLRWLHYDREQRSDRLWNRWLAIAAIVISLVALTLELNDRGFLGGLLDRIRTTQTSMPSEESAPPFQSQSQ